MTNIADQSETYTASVAAPSGITVTGLPASITVGPGQTVSFDITFTFESGPLDLWRFGSLTWSGSDHDVFTPIAIRPISVTAPSVFQLKAPVQ